MTKIKNKDVYPVKIPIATDYIVGSDSEKDGKTVNFQFDSFVDFINSINGTEIISYVFATSPIQELDENGYGYFLSENNIIDPANITELIISKKTKSLIDLTPLYNFIDGHSDTFSLKLRNLSDPNNFIYFNILDITEQDFQFTFSVEITDSDNFLGELEVKSIYGLEFNNSISISSTDDLPEGSANLYFTTARVLSTILTGVSFVTGGTISSSDTILSAFGKIQKQINDLGTSISSKLDKGGYTGTAQTLSDAIDAIFVPDQLVSAVAPTRSVNTFTYPTLGYTALISKTLRTNPAQFVTTINAASTTNHKRVDLIYFKPDNTLAKIIGSEDLIIAPRPDVPNGSVGVSFINVFGDIIETPTPITEEISIQDYSGVERFRITDYLRFKGVSFDSTAKALITDPLVPLAAFYDPTNGDDDTAIVENANKPFKTIQALLMALPPTAGETYTIYVVSGNVNFTRRVQPRNLRFISYIGTYLDFTNVLEDDGITQAALVLKNSGTKYSWYFENENISIISNYIGQKAFRHDGSGGLALIGTLNILSWQSPREVEYAGSFELPLGTDLRILNLYDSAQDTVIFQTRPNEKIKLNIQNWNIQYSRRLYNHYGNEVDLIIENIIQIGGAVNAIVSSRQYKTPKITVNNINVDGTFAPYAQDITYSGTVSGLCNVIFDGSWVVRGEIIGDKYHTNVFHTQLTTFKNFTGKIKEIVLGELGELTFENSNIEVETWLAGRALNSTIENCIHYTGGANTLKQIDTSINLFNTFTSPSAGFKPIMIDLVKLNTNALSYGVGTNYVQTQSTFKERLNEIVIRSKVDLINKILSSNITYVIDANLVLLSNEYIQVPVGGLTLAGYGFDVSSISKNVSGQSIFTSPSGNSGNFVTRDMMYSPGSGSVFDLTDSDGSHAIELNDVNFQGVTGSSLGIFNGYRQFTGTTCGFYGLSDGLITEGNWSGFKLTNSNVIGFGSTGTLFKKGTSTLFSNRFYIDLNIQISTGSKICDFADANFTNDKSLQVVNCYAKINGVVSDSTTSITFPNITPYSSKAYFVNNIGIKNSNNMPYGISTGNMQTYADDSAAAAGGIVAVGDTYIETSTGYFKKRLT